MLRRGVRRGRWSGVLVGATVKASGCWFIRLLPDRGCAPLRQHTLLCREKTRIVNAHSTVMGSAVPGFQGRGLGTRQTFIYRRGRIPSFVDKQTLPAYIVNRRGLFDLQVLIVMTVEAASLKIKQVLM